MLPRANGEPDTLPACDLGRASICIDAEEQERIDAAEAWIGRNRASLTVIEETGCGCCVTGWDVEGPVAVIASIPDDWRAASDWDDGPARGALAEGRRGLKSWWQRFFHPST